MSDQPKRRLLDRIGGSPTFIAEGTTVTGNIETQGPLVVSGAIKGNGKVGGSLSMSTTAVWEGEVVTRSAVIAGRVTGTLAVEEKLEVGASAVIKGDVRAKTLAIANGAVIDGAVTVTSGHPVVKFEEKRAATA
jgi:cytoskeletal protein CcmA (bactofilin family)